ncbi:MAG: EutN/CcmL family microcompartment protein [bacterium]
MKLGKIVGRVFCSAQCCAVDGKALLLVEPLEWETGESAGDMLVAADCVGAGAGEKVFFVQSREAAVAFQDWGGTASGKTRPLPPVDAAIVGIIDGQSIMESCE